MKLLYNYLQHSNYKWKRWFMALQKVISYDEQEQLLNRVFGFIKLSNIKGDYLEFGVWIGTSFIKAYHSSKLNRIEGMRYYAFDSFKGLPKIEGIDKSGIFFEGEYKCSKEDFISNLKKRKVDMKEVEVVEGFYKDTLNEDLKRDLNIHKASVIYIDVDLYNSAKEVLNFITDYIQDGTILIFDDWFCHKGNQNTGEQRAFKEWLKDNPKFSANPFYKMAMHGNSFIIGLRGGEMKIKQEVKDKERK